MAGKKKHAGGRPRKTLEEVLPADWKEIILEMSSQGCSDVEIRAKLSMPDGKFNHRLWYAIKEREDEFCETIKIGKQLCEAWWVKTGREGIHKTVFNTGLWYANMKNRFKWHDRKDVNLGGQKDNPIVTKDINSKSHAEILDLIRNQLRKK